MKFRTLEVNFEDVEFFVFSFFFFFFFLGAVFRLFLGQVHRYVD